MIPIIGIFLLPAARAQYQPICGTNELFHLGRAMAAMNMSVSDLNFDKDHGEPKSCLPWIREALNHPLMLPQKGDELLKSATAGDNEIWAVAEELLGVREADTGGTTFKIVSPAWANLDPDLAKGIEEFVSASVLADVQLKQAFARVDDEKKGGLAATIYSQTVRADRADVAKALAASGASPASIAQVQAEEKAFDPEPAMTNFLAIAAKIDRPALFSAGHLFQRAVANMAAAAASVPADRWPVAGAMFSTDLGLIIITPQRESVQTTNALLILDRSGNTTYLAKPGAANGLKGQRFSAIIDLGGDDRYIGADAVGPGGALFGVSVIFDAAGDDEYRAHYLGQGGAIFGIAWLEDRQGADRYDAWGFAQGAAGGGFAMLSDRNGDDTFNAGFCAQGFAGFEGVGLLIDDAGGDRYFAGNRDVDWNRNSGRFLSLSQGFSIGIRGFAGGGIGALIDRSGNDTYTADVYAQGASYWYSAGLLIDCDGHDNFTVYQYGQGSGIHLSLGMLADFAGNDRYTGYILSQGAGHDYGVGMLFDHAGDDTYVADHHSQGRALNTSLGMLVDSDGNDGYFARQNNRAQGIGNNGDNREYGSIALLADLAGNDQYSCGAKNDDRLLRPLFGVVYDSSTNAPFAKEGTK